MTAQATELADTARQLRELVARFRLEAEADAGTVIPRRRADDWGTPRAAQVRSA